MTIRSFLYCTTMYFIATRLLNLVNINAKEVIFQTAGSSRALQSENTVDVESTSMIECALLCLSNLQCCAASFYMGTSTCRIDTSEKCCIDTDAVIEWRTIRRNKYLPVTCAGCINFGNSMYSIIEDLTEWEKAKESCKCLGGNLAEFETSQENEFIKNEVMTRNTGVEGYYIGGYNFNNDNDMEWISKPNQVMPFNDMQPGQPNNPMDDLCMMIWKSFDFRWGDLPCDYPISYICEFQNQ